MDLTTLAGDDTPGRVSRLCHKALNPVRKDILEDLDVSKNVATAAVCISKFSKRSKIIYWKK